MLIGDKAAANTYQYIQVDVVIRPATAGQMGAFLESGYPEVHSSKEAHMTQLLYSQYGVNVKLQECFADNPSAGLESSSRDE
nr:transcription initiation factor TFIID subunit 10-like [Tanacetum cinerariifolium]